MTEDALPTPTSGSLKSVGSRWHRIFEAALLRRPAAGVYVTVADYLGRTPNRSEATAARRAAHSFAKAGHGQLHHVRTRGSSRLIILSNEVSSPEAVDLIGALRSDGTNEAPSDPRTAHTQSARRLVAETVELAAQARHLRLDLLTAAERHALAAALGPALSDLGKLRRRLGRSTPVQTTERAGARKTQLSRPVGSRSRDVHPTEDESNPPS